MSSEAEKEERLRSVLDSGNFTMARTGDSHKTLAKLTVMLLTEGQSKKSIQDDLEKYIQAGRFDAFYEEAQRCLRGGGGGGGDGDLGSDADEFLEDDADDATDEPKNSATPVKESATPNANADGGEKPENSPGESVEDLRAMRIKKFGGLDPSRGAMPDLPKDTAKPAASPSAAAAVGGALKRKLPANIDTPLESRIRPQGGLPPSSAGGMQLRGQGMRRGKGGLVGSPLTAAGVGMSPLQQQLALAQQH
eukprot:Hpha_TRINITY_DN16194_c0_g1::TRINITY_DN16194_c0_g1_i1::g.7090::m.7090